MQYRKRLAGPRSGRTCPSPNNAGTGDCHAIYPTAACRPDPARRGLHPCAPAAAQDYPSRPVTLIVPFSAGGGVDAIARLLAEKLRDTLKQNIVVENKPGASMLGAQYVAKAAPDGYTLLLARPARRRSTPIYKGRMLYSPEKDLAPVTLVTRVPNVLVAGPSLQASSVAELVERARQARCADLRHQRRGQSAAPERRAAAIAGRHHHGPCAVQGRVRPVADVASGNVDMTFVSYAGAAPFIQGGRVKALAVTSATRASFARDIPAIAETRACRPTRWKTGSACAPARTPPAVVQRVYEAVRDALADPALAQRLREQGGEPAPLPPAEFAAFIASEQAVRRHRRARRHHGGQVRKRP